MSVTFQHSADELQLTITIKGRFDFSKHQAFRRAYETGPKAKHFVVDLKDTTYIDSSALGMLLLLRDHAGGEKADVQLKNCIPDVNKILTISNFSKLFRIV